MYAVQATVSRTTDDGYESVRQVPTFLLDENVQGIVSKEHACRIASDIIDPYGVLVVNATAVKVS